MPSRIKTLREAAGLSQTDLAHRAGLSQSALSMIESGDSADMRLQTAARLAAALSVPVAALIDPPTPPVVSRQSSVVSDVASPPAEVPA